MSAPRVIAYSVGTMAVTLYHLEYLNRRNGRVWCVLLAGTTISRPSGLLVANARRGLEPLRLDYHEAQAMREAMNRHLTARGMPGRVFTVLDAPRVDVMAACREIASVAKPAPVAQTVETCTT